jgi:hypothetical protein
VDAENQGVAEYVLLRSEARVCDSLTMVARWQFSHKQKTLPKTSLALCRDQVQVQIHFRVSRFHHAEQAVRSLLTRP